MTWSQIGANIIVTSGSPPPNACAAGGLVASSTSMVTRTTSTPRRFPVLPVMVMVAAIACADGGTAPPQSRIEVTPGSVAMYESQSLTLTATVFDSRGVVAADLVTWTSAHPTIAQVGQDGMLFAASRGETTITATAGALSKATRVTVLRDSVPPTLDQVTIAPALVDLAAGDGMVTITFRARDAESGIRFDDVNGAPPDGPVQLRKGSERCSLVSGTTRDGVWRCLMRIHRYTRPGVWLVSVFIYDFAALQFDSATVPFTVANPRPDATLPNVTALTYTDERTTIFGVENRIVVLSASDAESGILDLEFFLADGSSQGVYACWLQPPYQWGLQGTWHPAPELTARCQVPLVASNTPVIRTISARVRDARGNVREYSSADLQQAGFITQIDIAK